jgi:hypothetical protein
MVHNPFMLKKSQILESGFSSKCLQNEKSTNVNILLSKTI